MSIANGNEQKRSPEFQELRDYLIATFGYAEGIEAYEQFLANFPGLDDRASFMIQRYKLKGGNIIDLFNRSKTRQKAYEETKAKLLSEAKTKQGKLETMVQLNGEKSIIQLAMESNRKDLPLLIELAEGKPTKEEQHSGAINILQESMKTNLKRDPMALQKLGKKWRKALEGEE